MIFVMTFDVVMHASVVFIVFIYCTPCVVSLFSSIDCIFIHSAPASLFSKFGVSVSVTVRPSMTFCNTNIYQWPVPDTCWDKTLETQRNYILRQSLKHFRIVSLSPVNMCTADAAQPSSWVASVSVVWTQVATSSRRLPVPTYSVTIWKFENSGLTT